MNNYFNKIKNYLLELDYDIVREDEEDGIFVVTKEADGVRNLVLGCADPILIMEQYIMKIASADTEIYKMLLQKNRDIIHGAFVLDDSGTKVIFRNTHEIVNLDLNELEATFNSLSLLLSEYSDELIKFSKTKNKLK